MAIDVSLSRTASGTELVSRFDVKGDGPLKPVVDRLFERRATERTAQFAQCLEKRFGGTAAAAVRPLAWWKRLFRRRASSPPSS
jgi:hypothetical protein